jgi:hypothetical protein
MKAEWTKLVDYKERNRRAQENGLIAAAQVVKNEVKRGLAGGYTSGNFVKGIVLNSVTAGDVEETALGFAIRIGTNLMYALFWELGHHNIFTRKYERVEIWQPAAVSSADDASKAYSRVFIRTMTAA